MYYLQGEVLHKTLVVKNEAMIEVVNAMGNVVVIDMVNDVVVNEVVIDVVVMDEVVMEEVSEVIGMWMGLDQQVCDGVQLVMLSSLDPQLPLPT
ncbi:hypothetical protein Tco_0944492 [Tanacetum coccineum]